MRNLLIAFALLWSLPAQASNALFARTHMLPTPFTLPAGKLVLGTDVAIGVTDFLQIGTSVLSTVYGVYNANAKVSLIDLDEFALAVTANFQKFNYEDISPLNPSIEVTSWGPGAIVAWQLVPNLAQFLGGRLSYSQMTQNVPGAQLSGYVQGAMLETDISFAHGPGKNPSSLVLSGGVSYDFTYEITGFGLSYHVPGLHFGVHYYPNADRYKVYPIIAGSTSFAL